MTPRIGSMAVGEVAWSHPRTLTLARALALSGGPWENPSWPDRNLHTSADAAAEAGLAQIVVSGTQWEGYLVGLLVELFGPGWFDGGTVDIKIPRSVRIGDVIRAAARLESLSDQDGRATAELVVWCENASGEQVMVGTASCPLPGAEERVD